MRGYRRGVVTLTLIGLALVAPVVASAALLTEVSSNTPENTFQQTINAPCVIGDESCKAGSRNPANFDNTLVSGTPGGGNGSTYDLFSPSYVIVSGNAVVGNAVNPDGIPSSFKIGVDENIAAGAGAEVLVLFKYYLCTTAACTTKTLIDSTVGTFTIPNNNNGNGFSDFLIVGFTSLPVGSFVQFEASVSNDTDGMEEFFILPAGTPSVPEPGTLLLLGTGLAALGALGRRKFRA